MSLFILQTGWFWHAGKYQEQSLPSVNCPSLCSGGKKLMVYISLQSPICLKESSVKRMLLRESEREIYTSLPLSTGDLRRLTAFKIQLIEMQYKHPTTEAWCIHIREHFILNKMEFVSSHSCTSKVYEKSIALWFPIIKYLPKNNVIPSNLIYKDLFFFKVSMIKIHEK